MSIFMLREMAQADPTGMMDEYIDAVEAEVERLTARLENVLDEHSEGAWMARALDAEREVERLREALDELERYADDAIGTVYGTLSALFVRGIARAALAGEGNE
jgi:ferric-dicitrate binding protein FerR (iron transport regulator)